MKKKIISILLGSTGGLFLIGFIILIPVLMILDFFGANITDGYIENNSGYAEEYKKVLNENIKSKNGYVSLERILYFYLADNSLTFSEIYTDNLDSELKRQLPISQVCEIQKYKVLEVCKEDNIVDSGQIDEEQAKPFAPPIDFASSTITSFFKEERIVYGESDVHSAWDLANSARTPVYSVCDGTVETVDFPYSTNTIDTSDTQGGNIIKINCEVNELTYTVLYGHLYPNSSQVAVGDTVTKGQVIASVGTTGYSTGDHLHYQVSLNNEVVDGMSLIDFTYEIDSTPSFDQPDLPLRPTY
ncbi:MAG TPA: M23 family metallopeptidase [Candidatus Faecimonas gallistercoris]|nr:M23 family metallopeptidase [Candidatus Faecimonas gallistercoris]